MLYLIHGDPNIVFKKSAKTAEALLKKKPDASVFKINQDNFSEDKLEELLGGQGLFVQKYIVSMSRLLEDVNSREYIIDHLKDLKESNNIFIWAEEKIEKKDLNKITKQAEKIEYYEIKEKVVDRMNIFDLANAIGERDKKKVWLLYMKALKEYSAEEIYGTIWWQVKSMLMAARTDNAKDAGMKDYPYKKSKGYLNNFKEGELDNFAASLVKIYHQSRLDAEDLELNLEQLLLKY